MGGRRRIAVGCPLARWPHPSMRGIEKLKEEISWIQEISSSGVVVYVYVYVYVYVVI
jgi:hypothetical protein